MKTLIVDLDDTLIATDLIYESFFKLLRVRLLSIFKIPYWLITGGLIRLKNELAQIVGFHYDQLPYRQSVLDLIRAKRKEGYEVGLVSASPERWVRGVAEHLGVFDFSVGSTTVNLKGTNKVDYLTKRLGHSQFTYVGDSRSDLKVWSKCHSAITVNMSDSINQNLQRQGFLVATIKDPKPTFITFIKQLRVHQWSKNVLLFIPALAAHKLQLGTMIQTLAALCAFSVAASAVYVFNDLIDLESDRSHHYKKSRPLAAGTFPVRSAIVMCLALGFISLVGAALVTPALFWVILTYYILNILYSLLFKKEVILDIILLASMYTIRLFAGGAATETPLSDWILAFSTFLFFSLACVKRCTELLKSQNKPQIDGRGYYGSDYDVILSLGIGTAILSVLVFLLYLQAPEVGDLYRNKSFLWLVNPVLLYWLGRIWILTGRKLVHDDPVIFAIKDRVSWACGLALSIIIGLSI